MISTHFRIIDYHDLLFKSSMNVYFVDFVGEERVYPVGLLRSSDNNAVRSERSGGSKGKEGIRDSEKRANSRQQTADCEREARREKRR